MYKGSIPLLSQRRRQRVENNSQKEKSLRTGERLYERSFHYHLSRWTQGSVKTSMPFVQSWISFVTDKRRTVDPVLWHPIATEQNTNTTQTNPGDTGYIWRAMTPTWRSYSEKINKTTVKIFSSPPGPQTDCIHVQFDMCMRFTSPCFSNLVSAVELKQISQLSGYSSLNVVSEFAFSSRRIVLCIRNN